MSGVNARDLIHEIKIRPGIYNREVLEPPRREHKHQLWLEVAERLTSEDVWDCYTDIEKDARIDEIAAKWKHVKTNFHRDVKLEEAGEGHKKRRYMYFKELEFMRPFVGVRLRPINKRGHDSVDSLDDTDDLVGNETDIDMESFLKSDEEESKDASNNSTVIQGRPKSKRLIKPTPKAFQNKSSSTSTPIVNRGQKDTPTKNFDVIKKTSVEAANPSFKIRDGDISFCLSLVPTLRKLGDGRKLKAKIEILKVLHKYVDHIERRNLAVKSNHQDASTTANQNADVEIDEMAEDHLEDYEEGVIIKNEEHDDPLNGNNGNTKTWWT